MGLKTHSLFHSLFSQTGWVFLQILRELLTLIPVKQTEPALHFLLFHVSNYSSWIPCGLDSAFQERKNHFISFIHPHKTVTGTLKHSRAMTTGHRMTWGWESQACGLEEPCNPPVPQRSNTPTIWKCVPLNRRNAQHHDSIPLSSESSGNSQRCQNTWEAVQANLGAASAVGPKTRS